MTHSTTYITGTDCLAYRIPAPCEVVEKAMCAHLIEVFYSRIDYSRCEDNEDIYHAQERAEDDAVYCARCAISVGIDFCQVRELGEETWDVIADVDRHEAAIDFCEEVESMSAQVAARSCRQAFDFGASVEVF